MGYRGDRIVVPFQIDNQAFLPYTDGKAVMSNDDPKAAPCDKCDVVVEKVHRDADHVDKLATELDKPSMWRRFVDWLANR